MNVRPEDPHAGETRDAYFDRHRAMSRLNDAVGCTLGIPGYPDTVAGLHLAPMYDFSTKQKIDTIKEGFRLLAEKLETDPAFANVEEIRVASWIVAEHSELAKRMGFHLRGPISPELKERLFREEKREVHWAVMSRREYLQLYGSKKSE